jgi:hypothetical protein
MHNSNLSRNVPFHERYTEEQRKTFNDPIHPCLQPLTRMALASRGQREAPHQPKVNHGHGDAPSPAFREVDMGNPSLDED